ncbi:MAG: hypothetical protein EXR93_10490 [Gemmatimonadetes bacterium]|nr:hypothetical protein [Gemmatimonadota bacterium]
MTELDRPAVLAALEAEIAGVSRSRNLSPVGGALFVLSVGMFFALSILTRRWALPILVRSSIYFVLVAGLLAGLGLLFFGGGSGQSRARTAAEGALDHLTRRFEASSAEDNLGAAVRLLWNVYYSGGPWMVTTIDTAGAREKLEAAGTLEWVQEVEMVLVEARRTQPVFTLPGWTGTP